MPSLPTTRSRLTTKLHSTNNPLVKRFLGQSVSSQPTQAAITPTPIDKQAQLQALETILTEVEASAQVLPKVIEQTTDTLNVSGQPVSHHLERSAGTTPVVDSELAGHLQVVEQEPTPELSPEVEGYLEAVEDHEQQQPQEIVIADGTLPTQHSSPSVKKVVVLPITEKEKKAAKGKNATWSVKWLWSWSERLIKMFQGAVIYRTSE